MTSDPTTFSSFGSGASATRVRNLSDGSSSGSATRERTEARSPGNTDSADGRPPYYEVAFIMKL
jgi:hypothetical protein